MEIQGTKKKKISDDLITCRGDSVEIPFDLIPEILKGLPVKTLARFMCVSKEYASIIRNRDFIKSYFLMSSNRSLNLIITFESEKLGKQFFFSSIQPQDRGGVSSVATYHMNCNSQPYTTSSPSVHGLICHGPANQLMIYNPATRRRCVTLPKMVSLVVDTYHYLGYDPIDDDYKLLCMTKGKDLLGQELRVLTLGNGNRWRTIRDCPPHSPGSPGRCINGVLYYKTLHDTDQAVMSFDVRSEKFHLIKLPETAKFTKLTSYEGKLAIMNSSYSGYTTGHSSYSIYLWVLVDAAKHEWSNKDFVVPCWNNNESSLQVFCHTDAGEFVLAPLRTFRQPFYVLYYDPKKHTVRRVFMEGITEQFQFWYKNLDFGTISIFPGQVENLMFL